MKQSKVDSHAYTRIKCGGLNLVKIIDKCASSDIEVINVVRTSTDQIEFSLTDSNFAKFKKLEFPKYEIEIIHIGGVKKLLQLIVERIGLVSGMIGAILLIFFLQNRLFHIKVIGNDFVSEQSIVNSINEFGINKFSLMNFEKEQLEKFLSQTYDFSLVSVVVKGNTLIVSVKEELPDLTYDFVPIVANDNFIITSIIVYSGISRYKNGDIIYKGDRIVEPYMYDANNNKIDIKPCAEIQGKTFFSTNYKFQSEENIVVKSGKSKIISSEFYLGKIKLYNKTNNTSFENYEIEEKVNKFSNYFLPIEVRTVVAHELINQTIIRDFNIEKEQVVSQLKSDAYQLVPTNVIVENEEVLITEIDNGFIINVYLTCDLILKYS